jgi:regulatory protein
MQEKKKNHTSLQALIKIRDWCAYQERCQQETRSKLYEYGLPADAVENIIAQLISDNFLNEERFAKAFAGGKFRIKKWGKTKIKVVLRAKQISEYCIKKAMEEIEEPDYNTTLKKLLEEKKKTIIEPNRVKKLHKLLRYAASKGYEHERIMEVLNADF